jgi:hypothetical protein
VVHKSQTFSRRVELQFISADSGFEQAIFMSCLPFTASGDWSFLTTDWDRDGIPDLVAIPKFNAGSHSTEVHILSGSTHGRPKSYSTEKYTNHTYLLFKRDKK